MRIGVGQRHVERADPVALEQRIAREEGAERLADKGDARERVVVNHVLFGHGHSLASLLCIRMS